MSDNAREAELRRELGRVASERDREAATQRSLRSDLGRVEEQLAIARKGINGLIEAVEQSRSELSLTRQELQILRRQQQQAPPPAAASGSR